MKNFIEFLFVFLIAPALDFLLFGFWVLGNQRGEIGGEKRIGSNQSANGRIALRLGFDIMTGKQIPSLSRFINYRGPLANAMPNVRLKSVPTNDQLNNVVTPIAPGQPEGIAWTWFDTQTYTSGTTTQLDFFQAIQADKVLGNMQAQGQFPNPMFFQLYHLMVYFDVAPASTTQADGGVNVTPVTGAINDVRALLNGSLLLNIAQKDYYQSKIGMCPAGYGPNGSISVANALTNPEQAVASYATNGIPDIRNRNCFWGLLVIPPTQNFFVRMNWTAALTLVNGNTSIVTALDGYIFRRVL